MPQKKKVRIGRRPKQHRPKKDKNRPCTHQSTCYEQIHNAMEENTKFHNRIKTETVSDNYEFLSGLLHIKEEPTDEIRMIGDDLLNGNKHAQKAALIDDKEGHIDQYSVINDIDGNFQDATLFDTIIIKSENSYEEKYLIYKTHDDNETSNVGGKSSTNLPVSAIRVHGSSANTLPVTECVNVQSTTGLPVSECDRRKSLASLLVSDSGKCEPSASLDITDRVNSTVSPQVTDVSSEKLLCNHLLTDNVLITSSANLLVDQHLSRKLSGAQKLVTKSNGVHILANPQVRVKKFDIDSNDLRTKRFFVCSQSKCDKVFDSREILLSHMQKDHKFVTAQDVNREEVPISGCKKEFPSGNTMSYGVDFGKHTQRTTSCDTEIDLHINFEPKVHLPEIHKDAGVIVGTLINGGCDPEQTLNSNMEEVEYFMVEINNDMEEIDGNDNKKSRTEDENKHSIHKDCANTSPTINQEEGVDLFKENNNKEVEEINLDVVVDVDLLKENNNEEMEEIDVIGDVDVCLLDDEINRNNDRKIKAKAKSKHRRISKPKNKQLNYSHQLNKKTSSKKSFVSFPCQFVGCNMSFHSQELRKHHVSNTHKLFRCPNPTCWYSSPSLEMVNRHWRFNC